MPDIPKGRRDKPRRRIPPLWLWILAALVVGGVVAVRRRALVEDNAEINVLTFVIPAVGCLVAFAWFTWFSGFSRITRAAVSLLLIAAIGTFFTLFKIEHVTGEMIPQFSWRFAPSADELLDKPAAGSPDLEVDLHQTSANDFSQFLGPNRSAHIDGIELAKDWESSPPELVWKQAIGAGWSAFSAVNGFAVTMEQRGDQELVTCYEIETGRMAWSYGVTARHSTTLGGVGPRSTPTIADGRVYALGASGNLACLDGSDGSVVWRADLLDGRSPRDDLSGVAWGRAASPLVIDQLVVVPKGGPADGPFVSLIAFDVESGEPVWTSGDRQVSYSSPVVATIANRRQILSVNEASVSGHDPTDGTVLWSHPWPGTSTADANNSQPVPIGDDRVFVSKGYGAGGMLLQVESSTDGAGFTAREVWSNQRVLRTKFTNVVSVDGYLYGLSDGVLECVAAGDGRRAWKRGRYHQGQILGVGEYLLVQHEHGDVALVRISPERFEELGRFPALVGKTWNNLCLFGEYLLVRNAEQACCYRLPRAS